jgi:DNA-binding transcriptional LysR family regulator
MRRAAAARHPSRTLASLERALGVRLLRRTSREVTPTATGLRVVAHARRVLGEVDELVREAASGHVSLRIGYAWSALGRHTLAFQRRWADTHPGTDLRLVRVNSPSADWRRGPATSPSYADHWTTGVSTRRS